MARTCISVSKPTFSALQSQYAHLYLIMLCICRRIVKNTSINQYTTNTGQNTGRLKISLQLQQNASVTALVAACQNLNSGSLRTNGLNS